MKYEKKIYKKYKAMVKRSLEYEFGWSCDQVFYFYTIVCDLYFFLKKKNSEL